MGAKGEALIAFIAALYRSVEKSDENVIEVSALVRQTVHLATLYTTLESLLREEVRSSGVRGCVCSKGAPSFSQRERFRIFRFVSLFNFAFLLHMPKYKI